LKPYANNSLKQASNDTKSTSIDLNNNNNNNNFLSSSPIVETLTNKLNKVSINNNDKDKIISVAKKQEENVEENDFFSDSSEEYYFVKPVEKIFNGNKDKEICLNLFGVLINKFQNDIVKLKEAKQYDSNRNIDEYNEKENYIQVLENIMNKYLKQ
jgi:hypothetical protein